MFDAFFKKNLNALSISLRALLGTIILIHGYTEIAGGMNSDSQFIISFTNLFCGLAILFGFFTRFVSALVIILTLFICLFSAKAGIVLHQNFNIETNLLIIATSISLVFMGSGKLSLENYFGFK